MKINITSAAVGLYFLVSCENVASFSLSNKPIEVSEINRRESWKQMFQQGNIVAATVASIVATSSFSKPSFAVDGSAAGSLERPVAIIGGGGRTGMAVSETLAGDIGQMYGVTMTRSGKDPFRVIKLPTATKERLQPFDGGVDVRNKEEVLAAFQQTKPSVVVYAASASKQGGNAFDVDDKGVGNVAEACKEVGAKLVLISALALDRPDSKSFQITNTIGGYLDKIMDAKFNGENKVRSIMGNDYIIIRPGVLLSGKSKSGANDIELNQGDTIGGGLSRDELAGVVVGAIKNAKYGLTVEAYRKSTATKLQPTFAIPSGKELYASSYEGFFVNAKVD